MEYSVKLMGRLFWAALLANERFVDVWNDTTTGNSCFDKAVQFFVTTDGQLQMTRGDTLHFQIF